MWYKLKIKVIKVKTPSVKVNVARVKVKVGGWVFSPLPPHRLAGGATCGHFIYFFQPHFHTNQNVYNIVVVNVAIEMLTIY